MDKFTKSIIKTFSVLFVVFVCTINLQAKESDYAAEAKSPPVIHLQVDTTSLVKLSDDTQASVSAYEVVEDTVLPPCDILFFKSGKLEYCKITETTATTVSYKMCDYLDGPTIIANKTTIHKIRYANGKEEVVTVEQVSVNAYVKARKDPMATWALICSLGGLLLFPAAIAGVILGIISLRRIKKSDGALRGKGAAKAAIIIGGILLLLYALSL